jgi:hypothetical protein
MAPNWQIMFHSCEWHQHVKKQPFFLPVLARLEMKLLPSYLEWRQMLIFNYHFHPKHKIHSNMDFFIQICSFSFKSSEFLMGRKTLWRFFYYNFRNIVLDSHFWKKKIATLEINHLIKKGWRHYPEDSELLMENRSLTSETWWRFCKIGRFLKSPLGIDS